MSPTAMLTMRAEYEPGVPTWQPRRTVLHYDQGQCGCVEGCSKSFENTAAQSGVWGTPTLLKSSYITYNNTFR